MWQLYGVLAISWSFLFHNQCSPLKSFICTAKILSIWKCALQTHTKRLQTTDLFPKTSTRLWYTATPHKLSFVFTILILDFLMFFKFCCFSSVTLSLCWFPHVSMYAAVSPVSTLSVSPGKLPSLTLKSALKSLALRQITNFQSDRYWEPQKLKMEDS